MSRSPKVYHVNDPHPPTAIYVGRPSKFGNPFKKDVHGKGNCVDLFRQMAFSDPEYIKMVRDELAGEDLLCWCRTGPCHALVLLEIANAPEYFL